MCSLFPRFVAAFEFTDARNTEPRKYNNLLIFWEVPVGEWGRVPKNQNVELTIHSQQFNPAGCDFNSAGHRQRLLHFGSTGVKKKIGSNTILAKHKSLFK